MFQEQSGIKYTACLKKNGTCINYLYMHYEFIELHISNQDKSMYFYLVLLCITQKKLFF